VRRRLALASSLLALALLGSLAPGAGAAQRVTASPNPVDRGDTLVVRGAGWPVIEFCSRRVRLSLRSAQNSFGIGSTRVRLNGRFRFEWPVRNVGAGRWRLVARVRCESGKDGSPIIVRASTPLRIR
jgi:hypothetical protein